MLFLFSIPIIFGVIYFLYACLVEVKVGSPPVEQLNIAYKYQYLGKTNRAFFKELKNDFPNRNIVKLCYSGPKSANVEYAMGVVIDENWKEDQPLLMQLITKRLLFLKTPKISNALYSEFFVIPWLPFTVWIAVALAYWKQFRYSEKWNLCGYPVLELYSNYKFTAVMPLIAQDDFVVTEAERIVYSRKTSAILCPLTSLSEHKKLLKTSKSQRNTKG